MQKIVNGYLYDTEISVLLYTDVEKSRRYYMTPNRRYFVLYKNGAISESSVDTVKKILGDRDIDKYIEIFGEPKEG